MQLHLHAHRGMGARVLEIPAMRRVLRGTAGPEESCGGTEGYWGT
jgi:hypothetical protein